MANRNADLISYCRKMSMSYSYKPVLIMALVDHHGSISIDEAANYFAAYYGTRLENGLVSEKDNSIFSNLNCSLEQIRHNIISNPVKALTSSSKIFAYDPDKEVLEIIPQCWQNLSSEEIVAITEACEERLEKYYDNLYKSITGQIICFEKPHEEYGFLSNRYESKFTAHGHDFTSMAQYLAYRKAVMIGDRRQSCNILRKHDPAEISDVSFAGRPELEAMWVGQKQIVAYQGLVAKFVQNDYLASKLLNTGSKILAACIPDDMYWGIGFSQNDERCCCMEEWEGKNILGFSLMQVRNVVYSMRSL
jgi:ribA/ribD-fused uncharacterized protein